MPISAKRKLVAGAAGLAVLAGSGGAYAAGQSGSPAQKPKAADIQAEQKAFLNDVAKRLNVTREQLDTALKGAAEARIDAAVAAGRLTQAQGEAAKQRLSSTQGLPFPGLVKPALPGRGGGPGFGHGGGLHFRFGGAEGAAEYLGLSEEELRTQLRDGKSLADIAKAENKSVEGLKAAIKAEFTERLDQAVKDGRLTQAERDEFASKLDERIDDIVNLTPPDRPAGLKFRWR
ncbi:hypothetical protein DVA67_011800 [Solirubrobacter sp. CPCC 204708]|uniref:Uncharacterized protein n=1 Tax=Solirubrobacter deserti TaxID=2282478 RepID=A0ABT4RPS0_9ACTN|nr:hypothetical protein [Solirubrobacter deserti]MBE2316663.1 hypothetical protein [Solirubrobacter deserti]MDA0140562.1 hypothetical protein [Solirubrobacter deserti]